MNSNITTSFNNIWHIFLRMTKSSLRISRYFQYFYLLRRTNNTKCFLRWHHLKHFGGQIQPNYEKLYNNFYRLVLRISLPSTNRIRLPNKSFHCSLSIILLIPQVKNQCWESLQSQICLEIII